MLDHPNFLTGNERKSGDAKFHLYLPKNTAYFFMQMVLSSRA